MCREQHSCFKGVFSVSPEPWPWWTPAVLAAGTPFVQPGGLRTWGMTLLACLQPSLQASLTQPVNMSGGEGSPVPPGTSGESRWRKRVRPKPKQLRHKWGGGKLFQTGNRKSGCSEARDALAWRRCRGGQGLAGRALVSLQRARDGL